MPKKRLGAEQIVTKLRRIEVLQGQGQVLGSGVQGGRARPSRAITDTERNTLVLTRQSGSNGSRGRTTGLRSWLLICRSRSRC